MKKKLKVGAFVGMMQQGGNLVKVVECITKKVLYSGKDNFLYRNYKVTDMEVVSFRTEGDYLVINVPYIEDLEEEN